MGGTNHHREHWRGACAAGADRRGGDAGWPPLPRFLHRQYPQQEYPRRLRARRRRVSPLVRGEGACARSHRTRSCRGLCRAAAGWAFGPDRQAALACIRMLFDWLVTGQVLPSNPAHAVRGPRYSVSKGVTPVLSSEEATALLAAWMYPAWSACAIAPSSR
jgi:hypothetical protein